MKKLLGKLIALRENGPNIPVTGICKNVEAYSDEFAPHYLTWPRYSGDSDYPVPSTEELTSAIEMYWRSLNKWEGKYGDLRRNLLDHLITEISKEVDSEGL
jgi:hypothetical protein